MDRHLSDGHCPPFEPGEFGPLTLDSDPTGSTFRRALWAVIAREDDE